MSVGSDWWVWMSLIYEICAVPPLFFFLRITTVDMFTSTSLQS